MRIPQYIQIAGRPWRIFRDDALPRRLSKHAGMYARGVYGLTLFDTREIILATGVTSEQEGVTFIHELLHAIYDASGDQTLGADGEERIIEALDEHLYSVVLQLIQNETVPKKDNESK